VCDGLSVIHRRDSYLHEEIGSTKSVATNEENILKAMREYQGFLEAIDLPDVRDKVMKDLGPKVVQLRQTSQIDHYRYDRLVFIEKDLRVWS